MKYFSHESTYYKMLQASVDKKLKYTLRPPAGESPRNQDTPRTRQLKELRQRRLAYFDSKAKDPLAITASSPEDVRSSMAKDPRVKPGLASVPNPCQVLGSVAPLQKKTSRSMHTIDVRRNNFALPTSSITNQSPRVKIKENNEKEHKHSKHRNITTDSVNDWEDIFEASKSYSQKSSGQKTAKQTRPISGLSSRPSTAQSVRSSSVQSLRSSKSPVPLKVKIVDSTDKISSNRNNSVFENIDREKIARNDTKYSDGFIPKLDIDSSNDETVSVSTDDNTVPAKDTPNDENSLKSSPRIYNLLEPQYEEDYSGLSLSGHQTNFQSSMQNLYHPLSLAMSSEIISQGKKKVSLNNDEHSTVKSNNLEDLETAKLESILGKDRFKRLLKNFVESDWALTSDESNVVTPRSQRSGQQQDQSNQNDIEIISVRTDDMIVTQQNGASSCASETENNIILKLGSDIKMENVDYSKLLEADADKSSGYNKAAATVTKSTVTSSLNFGKAEDYIKQVKEHAKVAFSAEQIYAQAERRSSTSTSSRNDMKPVVHMSQQHYSVDDVKPVASTSQSHHMSYRQWLSTELTKSGSFPTHQEAKTEVSGFTASSEGANNEPYFKQQGTLVDSESEFIPKPNKTEMLVTKERASNPLASSHSPEPSITQARHPTNHAHVLGIMQHMQKRELERSELPEPLPPGHFSSPSLERYFSSLENMSNGNISSQDFDPIEEPDIEDTPRDGLEVQGHQEKAVPRTPARPSTSKVIVNKEKPTMAGKAKSSKISDKGQYSSNTATRKLKSSKEPEISRKTQNGQNTTEARISLDTAVTMATEETSTSIWGEDSSGHTNVFLNKKKPSNKSDSLSDVKNENERIPEVIVEPEPMGSGHQTKDLENQESSLLSDETETGDLRKSDAIEVFSDFIKDRDNLKKNDEIKYKKINHTKNTEGVFVSIDNISSLVNEQGKISCPDCGELNKDYLKWCLECGAQLHGEDPIIVVESARIAKSPSHSLENIHKAGKSSMEKSAQHDKEKDKGSESVQASRSLQAAALRAEESFRHKMEQYIGGKVPGDVYGPDTVPWLDDEDDDSDVQHKTVYTKSFNVKNQEELGDSNYFEYAEEDPPSSRLSVSMKRELSIDLSGSMSRSQGRIAQVSPEHEKLVEISEKIDFEYENSTSPSKSLPVDLAEELCLDLADCLEQSLPASKLKKQPNTGSVIAVSSDHGGAGDAPNAEPVDDEDNAENGASGEEAAEDHDEDVVNAPVVHAEVQINIEHENYEYPDDIDYDDIPIDNEEGEDFDEETDEGYQIYLSKLRNDPRFRPRSAQSPPACAQGPTASRGRPQSASNAKSRLSVQSKVRQSWEAEPRPRRWEKSSVAWGSYAGGEMRLRSSIYNIPLKSKSTNSPVKSLGRPASSKSSRPSSAPRPAGNRASQLRATSAGRTRSSLRSSAAEGAGAELRTSEVYITDTSPRSSRDLLKVRSAPMAKESKGPRKEALGTYDKLLALSPRVLDGEISYWLCLPDEIWLLILGYLSRQELARCARTCKQLRRVATDDSLWRSICLKRSQRLCDDWLMEIGRRRPMCLALIKCQGEFVTDAGLRELFRMLGDSLQIFQAYDSATLVIRPTNLQKELNFTGCSRGVLTGDNILLHAAGRCHNITHLDASWCHVGDNGLVALSEACHRLEVLCVNGCNQITDDAVHSVLLKHGLYLQELELFGCFKLTARTVTSIMNNCRGLVSLNLGQCWKLSDVSLTQLASSSSINQIESLDIRGCKELKDMAVHSLLRNCRQLKTLSIANCPLITDTSLLELASQGQRLKSLDLNGCKKVTVNGIRTIALGCTQLQFLDISYTKASHKSVSQLASYCHRELEVLKINFCKDVTINSLIRLVKNCKQLKKLYLYGVKGLRNIEEVRMANPAVWIEM